MVPSSHNFRSTAYFRPPAGTPYGILLTVSRQHRLRRLGDDLRVCGAGPDADPCTAAELPPRPEPFGMVVGVRVGRWLMAALSTALMLAIGAPEDVVVPATGPAARPDARRALSPFAGTPAEAFPSGAAGIVLPPARAVPGGYLLFHEDRTRAITVGEVTDVLMDLREALIGARLDKRMLVGHDPDPFIRNLSRGAWDTWYDPYFLGGPWNTLWESPDFANVATKLAPGARLAAEPRVAGRITYRAATMPDPLRQQPYAVLKIVTEFVWVYAFADPPGIVVIRDQVTWREPTDQRLDWAYSNQGLHLSDRKAYAWGADCGAYADGLVRPGTGAPILDAEFDLDREPVGGCRPG